MADAAIGATTRDVDIWPVSVSAQAHAFAHHWRCLDAGERQRASSFHHAADRMRYVISRGTLRALLGRHLHIDPARVTFVRGEFGKPFVAGYDGVHVNSSHSGDWILHGMSLDTPVGTDVESLLPGPLEIDQFDHVLASQERDHLLSLPEAHRGAAFIEIWVCKEAYVKAIGQGVNRTLRDICIGRGERGGYRLLGDRNRGDVGTDWTLNLVDLGPAYAACIAYPGPLRRLRICDFAAADPAPASDLAA